MKLTHLDNGLRVASREMPGIETAAVGLYADTGSRFESEKLNGIAHLFEHMVFKGAGGRSAREISEAIEDVGGDLNAATDRDSTSFTASVMAEHIPLGVELIADLILKPHFAEPELEREKQVVLQELGEARDTPNDLIFEDLQSAAFTDQPLGRSILGSEESIEAIKVDDLHAWRETQYRGGTLSLVAAGKVDHDRLVALADKYLGALPPGICDPPVPATFTGGDRVGRTASDQAHLALGYGGPGQLDEDYYAARLFSDAVGGGMSSRLFQQLREDKGLAYSIYAMLMPWRDCGMFSVYAATARRESTAAAALVEEVLAQAAKDMSQRELDRVRTQARAGLLMSLESPWGQSHYVARMLSLHGRLVEPKDVLAELEAVTLDQARSGGREDARRAAGAGDDRIPRRPSGMTLSTIVAEPWPDYGLVDSGNGRKLERYGPYRFIRPEPQAMWAPAAPDWDADGEFIPGSDEEGGGRWQFGRAVPGEGWELGWEDVRFRAQCTPFRHLAFFPDMAPVWTWMCERIEPGNEVLNLFGYTGVGTLALAAKGVSLVHVDASKKSVEAGKENARLSGLADRPIRWMVDDAAKFAAREVRRGRRYDGIILDPPKFGRGPAGEIWKLEEGLPGLIADCRRLIDKDSAFLVLTVYAVRMSALAIGELLRQATADLGGSVEMGDMAVREEARGLLLPTAIFARWSRAPASS